MYTTPYSFILKYFLVHGCVHNSKFHFDFDVHHGGCNVLGARPAVSDYVNFTPPHIFTKCRIFKMTIFIKAKAQNHIFCTLRVSSVTPAGHIFVLLLINKMF